MRGLSVDDIVFTKPHDWEYEREWRMIKQLSAGVPLNKGGMPVLDDLGEIIYLFEFPPDIVQSVYLGSRITSSTKENLLEILEDPGYSDVEVYQARESDRFYSLDFDVIRQK